MKFDISIILIRHILSLKNHGTGRFDFIDFLFFYILPLFASIASVYFGACLDRDTYNASLALYSIFAALLLNVQVAIFGIFQRGWRRPDDEKLMETFEALLEQRRALLEELNVNVSYLIVVSCFSVSYFIVIYAIKIANGITSGVSIFLYCHFILTLFMVIKRAYALFDREYQKR